MCRASTGYQAFDGHTQTFEANKWLKSCEVEKLYGLSPNTLLTWISNGTLAYTSVDGIFYYDPVDIQNLLKEKNMVTKRDSMKK